MNNPRSKGVKFSSSSRIRDNFDIKMVIKVLDDEMHLCLELSITNSSSPVDLRVRETEVEEMKIAFGTLQRNLEDNQFKVKRIPKTCDADMSPEVDLSTKAVL